MPLDIEFSIKEGSLDVGVFAPSSILTEAEAEGLLDDLRHTLTTFN